MGFSHYGTKAYIMYPVVNGRYIVSDLTRKEYEYIIEITDGPEEGTKLIESMHLKTVTNIYANKHKKTRIVPSDKALIFDPTKWSHHDGSFKVSTYRAHPKTPTITTTKECPKQYTKCVKQLRKFTTHTLECLLAFLDKLHLLQIIKLDELQEGVIVKYDRYTLTNDLLLQTFRHDKDYSLKAIKFTIDTDQDEIIYRDRVYQNHVFLWVITEVSTYALTVTKEQWKRVFKMYTSKIITLQSAYKNETILIDRSDSYKVIDTYLNLTRKGI